MPKNVKLFKDDKGLNKCRDKSYQWIRILNILKMSTPHINQYILCNFNEHFNHIFMGLQKLILKLIWKNKGPRIAGIVLKRAREKALLCQISRFIRKLQYLIHSNIDAEINRKIELTRKFRKQTHVYIETLQVIEVVLQFRKDKWLNKWGGVIG